MFGTYIGNSKMLVKTKFNTLMVMPSDDLSLTPILVTQGVFEEPLSKFMFNYLKHDMKVLDVGANIGYFSVLMASIIGKNGKLICFEPNPNLNQFLKDNIAMNYLSSQTTLLPIAAFDKKDELTFHITKKFNCNSSINERNEDYLEDFNDEYEVIKVNANTIDSYIEKIDQIDLVKMDIEGGEYGAFKGMSKAIQEGKIKTIVFEWNREMLYENLNDFISMLEEMITNMGYNLGILNKDGNPVKTDLSSLTSKDWYPYVILQK